MDTLLRKLRAGVTTATGPPVVLVCDTQQQLGGTALLLQILQEYRAAQHQGRCQARDVCLVSCNTPPNVLARLLSSENQVPEYGLHVLDYCTDPWGWLRQLQLKPHQWGCSSTPISKGVQSLQDISSHFATAAAGEPHDSPPRICVVLDCISSLIHRHSYVQVLSLLQALVTSPAVSCVLAALHTDLHPPHEVEGLFRFAACTAELSGLTELQRELLAMHSPQVPHGQVTVRSKRQAGRLSSEVQLYAQDAGEGSGGWRVLLWAAPTNVDFGVAALVNSGLSSLQASQGQQGRSTGAFKPAAPQVASSMKLELTEQERLAKQNVVLPYEHHRQVAAAAPSTAATAGTAAAPTEVAQRLGEILYVRDSDQEHDSDEDPDDDLDF